MKIKMLKTVKGTFDGVRLPVSYNVGKEYDMAGSEDDMVLADKFLNSALAEKVVDLPKVVESTDEIPVPADGESQPAAEEAESGRRGRRQK